MTAAETIAELSKMGISVDCPTPGRIRLTAKVGDVPADAVALARDRKPELIDLLSQSCQPHTKPENYIEGRAPNRPGWIRTTCRVCGRFIGYRPST
ncbi:MAG: hypothetical protein KF752_08295 [Pirellulaceae bacterium]|nr:hypothetical protein [Pirellulaceae bacterium]